MSEMNSIRLNLFSSRVAAICDEMGLVLRRAAFSPNIKDRLDFSCALFDGNGNLVANAPHVPVHLGAMSESVKSIIMANKGKMKEGDYVKAIECYEGGLEN